MSARRSPKRSAMAPKTGWPTPQARFWIAIASENSARGQLNSWAMGNWNTPKAARTAKVISMTRQLAMRTGVTVREDGRVSMMIPGSKARFRLSLILLLSV